MAPADMPDISEEELRDLAAFDVPKPVRLTPPAPPWLDDCHALRAFAVNQPGPPDLADCAPLGTPISEHDPRLLFHAQMRTVRTPAISNALLAVAEQLRANRQGCVSSEVRAVSAVAVGSLP